MELIKIIEKVMNMKDIGIIPKCRKVNLLSGVIDVME